MDKNLESFKKLEDDVDGLTKLLKLLHLEKTTEFNKLNQIEKESAELVLQIELFSSRFSDAGWCNYDSMNHEIIKRANETYDKEGYEAAEQVLLKYYTNDVKNILFTLKSNDDLLKRYDLIEIAFNNHFERNYFSSVPLFLMVIDGAINDFTKSKGFFAEGTDATAWDCIVGCSDSLEKVKRIFTQSRKKTTNEMIKMPYRNGILHGRDLNFGNEYVSCKCVALLFAINDWLMFKGNEVERKQKFEKSREPIDFQKTIDGIKRINVETKEINAWKRRKITVGTTIKKFGNKEDYVDFDYLMIIFDLFEYWKAKNYGKLSRTLKDMFATEKNEKPHPKMCREFFEDKEFQSFVFLEVEERGCSLSRVLVEAKWKKDNKEFCEPLEFGCIYQNDKNEVALPWKNNGEWKLKTWRINGLYKF